MQPRSFRVEIRIALIEPMTSSTNSSTSLGQLLASARFARDQSGSSAILATASNPCQSQHERSGFSTLRLESIGGRSHEGLHSKRLLEHFKKQFYGPALLIDGSNRGSRSRQLVGQKYQK